MSKFQIKPAILIAVVGIALLFSASPARADLDFTLTITQGSASASVVYDETTSTLGTPTLSGASGTFSYALVGGQQELQFAGSVGTFSSVQLSAAISNSPSGTVPAFLNVDTQTATIAGSASGQQTLTIVASDQGYTAPGVGPAALTTGLSQTNITGIDTVTDTSKLDSQTGTTLTATGSDSAVPPVVNIVSIPGTPYTLQNTLTLTGSANQVLDAEVSSDVSPVPVPAGMVLALSGMPVLGLGYWLRRRKQVKQVRPLT